MSKNTNPKAHKNYLKIDDVLLYWLLTNPDFNTTENLWREMKFAIEERNPASTRNKLHTNSVRDY